METVDFDGFLFEKNKLKEFGFKRSPITYTQKIQNDELLLTIVIKDQKLQITVKDEKNHEPYTLYQTSAKGPYLECIRNSIRGLLEKLRQTCTIPAYFEKKQPRMVLDYIKAKYDVEPEFLWKNFQTNAFSGIEITKNGLACLWKSQHPSSRSKAKNRSR